MCVKKKRGVKFCRVARGMAYRHRERQRVVINGASSDWEGVISGVPQGSVLGPILFTIFINDLNDNIKSLVLKFADDTKLAGRVGNTNAVADLRKDLGALSDWSKDWEMPFNVEKCNVMQYKKVMHIGNKNVRDSYTMGGKVLDKVSEEKDLGVIVEDKMKMGIQCTKAANKRFQILGMISRTFSSQKSKIIVPLYKALVRPHLDYCIQAWRPHFRKYVNKLERVQMRATRMIEECRGRDYETRLGMSGLTTLESRALQTDMLEVFRIMNKIKGIKEDSLIRDLKEGRRHSFKLFKKRV